MGIGSPIEEQCVRMFGMVWGNNLQSIEDIRATFHMQHPSIIAGWERLAKSVMEVTTPGTFNHVSEKHATTSPDVTVNKSYYCPPSRLYNPSQEEQERMAQ